MNDPRNNRGSRTSSTGRRRVIGAAAVAVGLILVLLTNQPRPANTGRGLLDSADRVATRRGNLEVKIPELRSGDQDLEDGEELNETELTVIDAETGRPVPEAKVSAYRQTGNAAPFATKSRVYDMKTTEQDGRAVLRTRGSIEEFVVRVDHESYSPAETEVTIRSGSTRETVRLDRGKTMAGRVVDATGAAVGGVRVCAMTPELPERAVRGDKLLPSGLSHRRSAVSDAHGGFEIHGLRDGTYLVMPSEDGWRMIPPRNLQSAASRDLGGKNIFERDADVVLRVERVRAFRVRLIDALSGAPVVGKHVLIQQMPDAQSSVYPPHSPAFISPGTGADGAGDRAEGALLATYSAHVGLRPGMADATEVDVSIQAVGCKLATARVRLFRPGELRHSIEVDEVRLAPVQAFESCGKLRFVIEREGWGDALTYLRGTIPYLECALRGAEPFHIPADAVAADRIEFGRVPSGTLSIRFSDGLSSSEMMEIVLARGESKEIQVSLPPPTGAILDMRSALGVRVFDADIVLLAREGVTRASRLFPGVTAYCGEHRGKPVSRLIPLEPGTYSFSALKSGLGDGSCNVEIRSETVKRARIVLGGPDDE